MPCHLSHNYLIYAFLLAENLFFLVTKIQFMEKYFDFNERIFKTQLESPQNLIQTEFPLKLEMIEDGALSFLTPS